MSEKSKVILITGCSSGFGKLMALELAKEGYRVYASMRNLSKSDSLKKEAGKASLEIPILKLDVTRADTIKEAVNKIEKEQGRLDVLINNAGFGMGGFFADMTDDEFRAVMETNFFGVLNVIREALPLLMKSPGAKIINISSMAGLTTTPAMSAYNASKWALEGFSECLRQELALIGIQVILVEPGAYPTEILKSNTRFAKNAENPESPFYPYTKVMFKRFKVHNENLHSDPGEIPRLIQKLIEKKRPRFRNIIGPQTGLRYVLKRFFPWWLNERLLRLVVFRKWK